MDENGDLADLVDYLARSSRLSQEEASRLVAEVLAYLSESPSEFVSRRHAELQRDGVSNRAIYLRLARELQLRRFTAPPLSERQIRRFIYG